MSGKNQSLEQIREKLRPVLEKHDVVKAEIFGSYARREQKDDSDIDILVEMERGKTLVDIADLKRELEEATDKEVDILTYDSVNSEIRERIFSEAVEI